MPKLVELCRNINMGQSPASSSYNENADGLPFFQGNADFGKLHPITRVWCNDPKKIAHPDDILISVRAPIGALNIADQECCIGRGLAAITVNDEICNRMYMWYALKSKVDELNSKGTGSTFKAITKAALYDTIIPAPSMTEQDAIAEELDTVQDGIDKCSSIIEKIDLSIKARFVEMFGDPMDNSKGYPVKAMSEIAEYWNGLTYKPEDVAEEGTIVLRSSNIQNMQLDFSDIVRVNCKIAPKKYVQNNDILMCSRNGSAKLVGKVALIHDLNEPMCFGAFMMIIRSEYFPYLMTYFQFPAFRSQISTGATTTINQITVNMMNKVMLPVPDKESIGQFASFVEEANKSKAVVQNIEEKLKTLQASLMQQYFG